MAKKQKSMVPKPEFRKPPWYMNLLQRALGIYSKINYRAEFSKEQREALKPLKGKPFIALATHSSPMDFALAGHALRPWRGSMVIAVSLFYLSAGGLARGLKNSIPKKQFTKDPVSVRNIKRMIDAGIPVLMFPEAMFTLDGNDSRLSDTHFKLLKWLKVPVVVIRVNGGYCTRPRYFRGFRKGKMVVDTNIALTAEECATLSVKEIRERVMPLFKYSDCNFQQDNNLAFVNKKRSTTDGIIRILFVCPKCAQMHTIIEEWNAVSCTACGNKVVFNEYGKLLPESGSVAFDRLDLWCKYQYNHIKNIALSEENYVYTEEVKLEYFNTRNGENIPVDEGILNISENGFEFIGKEVTKKFPLPNPPCLPMQMSSRIDLFEGDILCKFVFKEKFRPVRAFTTVQALFDIKEEKAKKLQ
ncbi:MAG: 1-acyl-sn-glycerol-3-phosphate acyltransferase [Firmicutes bacterium]|nr:1-acyl-sn-glycerol-3-phosphate acyltransferase [Bacillota bacterium]